MTKAHETPFDSGMKDTKKIMRERMESPHPIKSEARGDAMTTRKVQSMGAKMKRPGEGGHK